MARPKTFYLTYMFESDTYDPEVSFGYSSPIHCNTIQKIETEDFTNKKLNFTFDDDKLFPFMRNSTKITTAGGDGSGWSANRLIVLAQVIDGIETSATTDSSIFRPNSANWKRIDVTNRLDNYSSFAGKAIDPASLATSIIEVEEVEIVNGTTYDLSYLNYPTKQAADDGNLVFGEEAFFYGNVNTDIEAVAYTTEIPITLNQNEYNSTTNPTWDQQSPVQISEIGIYDDQNRLVAIGKLNNPIDKDASILRNINFEIDF